MKNIALLLLLGMISSRSLYAQGSSTLNQNFNSVCITSSFPGGWHYYNPVMGTYPDGAWSCSATDGRGGTPGMECTNYYSGIFHLDTSYLITPTLNFDSYTSGTHVYLQFDSKASRIHDGSNLDLMISRPPDSLFHVPDSLVTVTGGMIPVFSSTDSSDWVRHEVDLSHYIGSGDFYFGFRYGSPSTTGSIWYLDNVSTSTVALSVSSQAVNTFPFSIIGTPTASQVVLSYRTKVRGDYSVTLYDYTGKVQYKNILNASAGSAALTISDLHLIPGVYIVKMEGAGSYATARFSVQ